VIAQVRTARVAKRRFAVMMPSQPGQHSGPLADLLTSIMGPSEAPAEKSVADLAKMSKADRKSYHEARLMAAKERSDNPAEGLSKADKRALAREKQDQDRKRKDVAAAELEGAEEALADLKLQGLTEEQARVVLAQIAEADAANPAGDEDDEDIDATLIDSVRDWMAAQEQAPTGEESMRDFNLKVRFQGHVETTPPDHLSAILHILSAQISKAIDPANPPKQPAEVAKGASLALAKWTHVVAELYKRCDVMDVTDILVSSVYEGIAEVGGELPEVARGVVLVGFLMAVRDEFECIGDEDILAGCHQLESESKVVKKFVAFLQEEIDGSDGDADADSDSEG